MIHLCPAPHRTALSSGLVRSGTPPHASNRPVPLNTSPVCRTVDTGDQVSGPAESRCPHKCTERDSEAGL